MKISRQLGLTLIKLDAEEGFYPFINSGESHTWAYKTKASLILTCAEDEVG